MCLLKLKKKNCRQILLDSRCNPICTPVFEVSWPMWTLKGPRWENRAEGHSGHSHPLTTSPLIIFIMQVKKWMETMRSLPWWWRGLALIFFYGTTAGVGSINASVTRCLSHFSSRMVWLWRCKCVYVQMNKASTNLSCVPDRCRYPKEQVWIAFWFYHSAASLLPI